MKNLIKLGTIVALIGQSNAFGIVIENTKLPELKNVEGGYAQFTGRTVDGVILYNGRKGITTIVQSAQVDVINTNYINSTDFEDSYAQFVESFNKATEWAEKRNEAHTKANQKAFEADLKAAKPKELRKKAFIFDSHYSCPNIVIEVKEWKKNHGTMYFNGAEITLHDISQLRLATKLEVAGRKINAQTMKIGDSIGYTQTLIDAIAFFDSIEDSRINC